MRKPSFLVSVAALAFAGLGVGFSAGCDKGAPAAPAASGPQAPSGLPAGGAGANNAPSGMPDVPNVPGVHGENAGGDPHAGLDMNGAGGNPHGDMNMNNPHGGGGGMEGTMPAPGELDPKTVINGTIDVAPALAAKVKPGDVIFLSLKSVDPTTGELKRPPLAVDRLDVQKLPVSFELSNQKLMIAGSKIEGQVAVTVRIDRDADAMTRTAGDLEGIVKTTAPQKDLKVVIDTEVK
jgi:hypothetical protein